jgi:GNAT superfamily N-acetyltransferase
MLEIRPCADRADDERSVAIYNAVWPWDAVSVAEADSFKAGCLAWIDLLAHVDGDPIGSGFAAKRLHRPTVGFVLLTVLPDRRHRGAGGALYRAISDWGRENGLEALDAVVHEDDPDSIAFAERRGFVEVERNSLLVLELADYEPAAVAPPAGIEITTWAERPELARGIYDVACQAYADVPGRGRDQLEPFEHWLEHDMQGSGDRPDATFVALDGDDVVGYAKLSFMSAQPDVAFHDMTGVRRDWRGRGVAGALKRAQIPWAQAAGFARMQTQNEARNEPIRRINERLGYREAPGEVVLRGPLAS